MRLPLSILVVILASQAGACGRQKTEPASPAAPASRDDFEPAPPSSAASADPSRGASPVLLGWFCPDIASGRPGVVPLLAREDGWTSDSEVLDVAVTSRRVKRFAVFSWLGSRAGSLPVAGGARTPAAPSSLAVGAYLGSPLCSERDARGISGPPDPVCEVQSRGCGPAVAAMESAGGFDARPYEEDPESTPTRPGIACEMGTTLVVDIDGDGQSEAFSLAQLETQIPTELPLLPEVPTCQGNFAAPVTAVPGLVRAGVFDLDGDGRLEVLYRRGAEEFLLYGAPASPARLELLGQRHLSSPAD